jgi:DNA-binding Lrp family transcriptional regulator
MADTLPPVQPESGTRPYKLTPRRVARERLIQVLDFIKQYAEENGGSPSIQEISEGVDLSRQSVFIYLNKLQEIGCISRAHAQHRSIRLVRATLPEDVTGETPLTFDEGEWSVYFLQDRGSGLIKIGRTTRSPLLRFPDIVCDRRVDQTGDLVVLGVIPDVAKYAEMVIHQKFDHLNVRPKNTYGVATWKLEWFRPEPDLLAFIAEFVTPWEQVQHLYPLQKPFTCPHCGQQIDAKSRIKLK